MDVLRRHRTIVAVGVGLTLALAILSYVRISPEGIAYRSPEIWSNQATLVLTQEGAPELRSVLPNNSLADTGRFAGLIDVYATLATSDAVVGVLRRRGLVDDEDLQNGANPITAAAVVSTVGGGTTPLMTITARAESGVKATALTRAATSAFLDFVRERQLAAKIPVRNRIQIRVVKSSVEPTLVEPRSKALPILVLLGGLIATAGVAFTRDNLRRREHASVVTTTMFRGEPGDVEAPRGVGAVPRQDSPIPREREALPDAARRPDVAEGRWARRGRSAHS